MLSEQRFIILCAIVFILWCLSGLVNAQQQERKVFWDNDQVTTSESVYSLGGGVFVKAIPVEIKYQETEMHIIWQLNVVAGGRVTPVVWREVSRWDADKKEFSIVSKEAFVKTAPQVSIDEFSPAVIDTTK